MLSISRNVSPSVPLSVRLSVRLSVSLSVRLSVCLSVCVTVCSLLRYRLNVVLPQLPEVGRPIFLEIRNPWGKIMERSGLRFEYCCLEVILNRQTKFFWLIFPTKQGGNHASR